MTAIVRDPLLRALQGEEDVLYTTEDGTVLAKFDHIEVVVADNGTTNYRFMKDNTLVASSLHHAPIHPGQTLILSVRGGLEARLTV